MQFWSPNEIKEHDEAFRQAVLASCVEVDADGDPDSDQTEAPRRQQPVCLELMLQIGSGQSQTSYYRARVEYSFQILTRANTPEESEEFVYYFEENQLSLECILWC